MTGMIKLVVAGAVTLGALLVGFGGLAFAQTDPHGSYERYQTDACAGCHRAHTAISEDLKTEASGTFGVCMTCHNGVGSNINVMTGTGTGGKQLNSGSFQTMGGVHVSSTHTIYELEDATGYGTAWGGASSGAGVYGQMLCTSCHDPHGTSNYRDLRDSVSQGGDKWVPNDPNLLDFRDNEVLSTADEPTDGSQYTSGLQTYYTGGMNDFCATCHKEYLTVSGSSSHPSTDPAYYMYPGTQSINDSSGNVARYRHVTSRIYTNTSGKMLRFAAVDATTGSARQVMTCLTCHYAHGTTAGATGFASHVAPTNDSALLFYSNRGVCRECHQQNK